MSGHRPQGGRGRQILEWGKNLLIAVLALSAIYLALRTGLYTDWNEAEGGIAGWFTSLFHEPAEPAPSADPARPAAAALPVRIAVYSEGSGRYGAQYDAALTNTVYDAFSSLLGEALASAGEVRTIPEAHWRDALERPGVYFDYLYEVPLEALSTWLSEDSSPAGLGGSARRVLLAQGEGDAVTLYYSNESDGMYYACDTAVSYVGHLRDAVEGYGSNGATFVFEYGAGSGYEGLDPYVMILSAPPAPQIYRGSNPVDLADGAFLSAVQTACGFPVQTSSTYQVRDTVRIRDGNDALSIDKSGEVTFTAGDELIRYPVEDESAASLIEVCRSLVQATVGTWCGEEAQVTLTGLKEQDDGSWEVTFGYLLNGAAVQLYGDGYAALFRIQNGRIDSYTLRFRHYEGTGEQSLVMRALQAAAAMRAEELGGRELALCYEDSGGESIRAGWVAR